MTLVDASTGEVVLSGAVVPFDAAAIELAADPGQFVVLACERAKQWLTEALDHGDIDQIVELKSQAEAIRVYTTQKQLGHDAELAATEIVRRAERGIGLAIRRGQEAGEIRKQGPTIARPTPGCAPDVGPTDFLPQSDLSGSGSSAGIYDLTDEVTDEQFEDAVEEAKAEGNLSRANVVRKVKPDKDSRRADRPDMLRKTRRIDPDRVVDQIAMTAAALISPGLLDTFDFAELDGDHLEGWVTSLSDSIRSLTTLRNRLKKEMTQ